MPSSFQNFYASAKSPIFLNSVKAAMVSYATTVQKNFTPVVSPTPGYKAYDKQVAFARQAIQNPDLYVEAAARLILTNEPNIEFITTDIITYLINGNSSGRNVFECIVYRGDSPVNGWEQGYPASGSPGDTIWDALAGVNQSDFI
jgi:hypothetical protein